MSRAFVAFATVAICSPASAQEPAAAPSAPSSRLLKPGNIDLRAMMDSDAAPPIASIDLGAGADVGLLHAGPGTIALGGEFQFGFCTIPCLVLNALTGLQWGVRYFMPFGRLAYHFDPRMSGFEKLDVYGFSQVGLVLVSSGVSSADGKVSLTGTDTSLAIGLGAGARVFFGDTLFLGGEGRFRYARGKQKFEGTFGNITITDEQASWNLTGLNLVVFIGARI